MSSLQNVFLDRMAKALNHVSQDEKNEILNDYCEHFEIGLASGKTEEQVAAALGEPEQLAKMYTALGATKTARHSKGLRDAVRMIGALIRYKLGGGLIMGTLYFICVCILGSLFATAGSLILAGAASVVFAVIEFAAAGIMYGIAAVFTALVLGSGGLLGVIGSKRLWQLIIGNLPSLAQRLMQAKEEEYENEC